MFQFLLNILLAFAWMFLSGDLNIWNFVEGMLLGYGILWIGKGAFDESSYFSRAPRLVIFVFYFIYELLKANFKVAVHILTPKQQLKPGIIAFPLDCSTDFEITMFANLITLTPGTLSLDISGDKKVLYVHAMFVEDAAAFKDELKTGLERRLLDLTRGTKLGRSKENFKKRHGIDS